MAAAYRTTSQSCEFELRVKRAAAVIRNSAAADRAGARERGSEALRAREKRGGDSGAGRPIGGAIPQVHNFAKEMVGNRRRNWRSPGYVQRTETQRVFREEPRR